MTDWTTPEDIAARVRRRWDDGSLLAAYALAGPCPVVEVLVRGPAAREIGADLAAVQAWHRRLVKSSRDGAGYQLTMREVGGRAIGRNTLPSRARVTTFDQAWRLLGVKAQVEAFDDVLTRTRAVLPELVDWVSRNPLRALAVTDEWPRILAAVTWLRDRGGQGLYVRQIEAEGVDTKFVARHRGTIAALLDVVVPAERVAAKYSRGDGFAERYGFAAPPRLLRMRIDEGFGGMPAEVTEVAMLPSEVARMRVSVGRVVVVENEVTYLAMPVPVEGVVVWGAGYAAGGLGRLPWVRDAEQVLYCGDLDTHGFAILSVMRGQVPQTQSLLMDEATLLAHRERWGREPSPTRGRLENLSEVEQALYQDLVEDVHAPSLRLEQERLDWRWVEGVLAAAGIE
ncbi:MAG: Wadjet anti-phage system protein JetD domain-containing protein [Pedococcus sp.]